MDAGRIRQPCQLVHESLIEQPRVTAVVAVARSGIEQCVAAEQLGGLRTGEQADVRHRVARGVQTLELHAAADPDRVAAGQAAIDAADARSGPGMCQDLRAGRGAQAFVPAGMVQVFVGVEDLRDREAARARDGEALAIVERVHGQRLARFGAGNQVVEIPVGVGGPDAFDEHATGRSNLNAGRIIGCRQQTYPRLSRASPRQRVRSGARA